VIVQSSSGTEELCERLWNQDLAVCINMFHIVRNLRLNGEKILERFQGARAERRVLTRRKG
jgi:hypothetical protein